MNIILGRKITGTSLQNKKKKESLSNLLVSLRSPE